MYLKHQPLST